jgi:hypothetical protein
LLTERKFLPKERRRGRRRRRRRRQSGAGIVSEG